MASHAQLVVTGFHRSGTSMAMQAMKKAGLYIGDSLIGAETSNPDGHFEDVDAVNLHDSWLSDAQLDWCCTQTPPRINEAIASSCIEPIAERLGAQRTIWGFKDPRAALYLPEWFSVLDNPYGIFVYRHYASCLSSLQRRQANALFKTPSTDDNDIRFWITPDIALQSWLVHNQALLNHIETYPKRCVLVAQEAQIAGENLASIVTKKLPINLKPESATGVDKAKSTNQKTLCLFNSDLRHELDDTWNKLQALADASASDYPTVQWQDSIDTDTKLNNLDSDNKWNQALVKLHNSWDVLGVTRPPDETDCNTPSSFAK